MKRIALLLMAIMFAMCSIGVMGADTTKSKVDTAKVKVVLDTANALVADTTAIAIEPTAPTVSPDPQFLLYLCAFIGLLGRAVWNTYKGIRSTVNGTANTFDFQHWLQDNVLSKLAAVMAIVIGLKELVKLPDTTMWKIIMCVFALVIGICADFAADKLKWLTNKAKMLAMAKQIKAITGDTKIVATVINQMGATAVASDINKIADAVNQKVDQATK